MINERGIQDYKAAKKIDTPPYLLSKAPFFFLLLVLIGRRVAFYSKYNFHFLYAHSSALEISYYKKINSSRELVLH